MKSTDFVVARRPRLAAVKRFPVVEFADYERRLAEMQKILQRVQQAYLGTSHRAIIVLEGWDTAGKGGVVRRLGWALDPRSFKVHAIAAPTSREKSLHYLQRFWERLPEHGQIVVFGLAGAFMTEIRTRVLVGPDRRIFATTAAGRTTRRRSRTWWRRHRPNEPPGISCRPTTSRSAGWPHSASSPIGYRRASPWSRARSIPQWRRPPSNCSASGRLRATIAVADPRGCRPRPA